MATEFPTRPMAIAAGLLAAFATVGVGLVAFTENATRERIARNERDWVLRSLNDVLPADRYDNTMFDDLVQALDPELLGSAEPVNVYRARRGDAPVAAILEPVAPNGYSGAIRLLVGVQYDGRVTGVRVVNHRETPGLGDAIEVERSDWILGFDGKTIVDPPKASWKVRRDGGEFDQFTGATITPRAVVGAVRDSLIYFEANRERIFQAPAGTILQPVETPPAQPDDVEALARYRGEEDSP